MSVAPVTTTRRARTASRPAWLVIALVAIPVLPSLGWQAMYLFAFSGFALLTLTWFLLPESPTWLRAHGHVERAEEIEVQYGVSHAQHESPEHHHPSIRTILRPRFALGTTLFSLATIATLFAWYGLGTWLPKLMGSDPRFDLGNNPLTFLLALNVGAVVGSVFTAYSVTRIGPLRSAVGSALAAAAGLSFLLTYPSSATAVYAALILAGSAPMARSASSSPPSPATTRRSCGAPPSGSRWVPAGSGPWRHPRWPTAARRRLRRQLELPALRGSRRPGRCPAADHPRRHATGFHHPGRLGDLAH